MGKYREYDVEFKIRVVRGHHLHPAATKFIYLAVSMDIFTRAIRASELSRNLTEELTKVALVRAG